jgi:hypothetical protein
VLDAFDTDESGEIELEEFAALYAVLVRKDQASNLERIAESGPSLGGRATPPRRPNPQQTALPVGWEALTDPATNRVYYYETSTGQTSWTMPSLEPRYGGANALII